MGLYYGLYVDISTIRVANAPTSFLSESTDLWRIGLALKGSS